MNDKHLAVVQQSITKHWHNAPLSQRLITGVMAGTDVALLGLLTAALFHLPVIGVVLSLTIILMTFGLVFAGERRPKSDQPQFKLGKTEMERHLAVKTLRETESAAFVDMWRVVDEIDEAVKTCRAEHVLVEFRRASEETHAMIERLYKLATHIARVERSFSFRTSPHTDNEGDPYHGLRLRIKAVRQAIAEAQRQVRVLYAEIHNVILTVETSGRAPQSLLVSMHQKTESLRYIDQSLRDLSGE